MSKLDFHFEFYSELQVPEPLIEEAESRLQALADGHTDLIGAAVTVEELSNDETPHSYRARVVAYIRPTDIAGIEMSDTMEGALKGALVATERQIRKKRDKLAKPWEQPEKVVQMSNVYELTARELYDAYAADVNPVAVLNQDRTIIAAELMTREELNQDAAFYAADQILAFAQEISDSLEES